MSLPTHQLPSQVPTQTVLASRRSGTTSPPTSRVVTAECPPHRTTSSSAPAPATASRSAARWRHRTRRARPANKRGLRNRSGGHLAIVINYGFKKKNYDTGRYEF